MTGDFMNSSRTEPSSHPASGMEKRQITVMFADLVGSIELSRTLDPEDVAALTVRYQLIVEAAAKRFGGHISRFVGDGVLVLFGWPEARENDPERAVRAALDIHAALADDALTDTVPLRCHIGIATGMVMVGDVAARNIAQSDAVFGETPNLAARLQTLAGPAETVISESTWRCVSDWFACRSTGQTNLAGFVEPVRSFRVMRPRDLSERLKRTDQPKPCRMIGRDAPLATLREKWNLAKSGKGQIAVVSGEAGIGKTRLMFEQRADDTLGPHTIVFYHCSPFHSHSALYPFITHTEHWCGILDTDSPTLRREKVAHRVGDNLSAEQFDLLMSVLAPTREHEAQFANTTEQDFWQGLFDIFLSNLKRYSKEAPVLMHFEDIHWIDPSSLKVVRSMIAAFAELPVLCVLSHRSDMRTDFLKGPHVTHLTLEGLEEEDARDLVDAVKGNDVLEPALVDGIVQQTNGVPLFIEECTAAICKSGMALPGTGSGAAPIPESLYDLLTQQLDGARPFKPLLLAGAVAGRVFDLEMVAHLTGLDLREAEEAARILIAQNLLLRDRTRDASSYQFRHALVREAAYRSLVKPRRLELHGQIASFLELHRPELATREPELLAWHFQQADLPVRAVSYWTAAAARYLRRFANREADQHARNGLTLLADVPEEGREVAELQLQSMRAMANRALRGYGAPDTIQALERAFELAEKLGDRKTFVRAGRGLFTSYQVLGDYQRAGAFGHRIAAKLDDNHANMVAHYIIGVPLTWRGRFHEASDALRKAEAFGTAHLAEAEPRRQDVAGIIQIGAMNALVEAYTGNGQVAMNEADRAIALARQTGQPLTLANAVHMACNVYQMLTHPDAMRIARDLEEVSDACGYPFYVASAKCHIGGALLQSGAYADGYDVLSQGWTELQATGNVASGAFVWAELAKGCHLLGRHDEGLEAIGRGLDCVETYDERNFEAELHRIHGLLQRDGAADPAAAEKAFRLAAHTAHAQGARLFELRALVELTALRKTQTDPAVHVRLAGLADQLAERMPASLAVPDIDQARKLCPS